MKWQPEEPQVRVDIEFCFYVTLIEDLPPVSVIFTTRSIISMFGAGNFAGLSPNSSPRPEARKIFFCMGFAFIYHVLQ